MGDYVKCLKDNYVEQRDGSALVYHEGHVYERESTNFGWLVCHPHAVQSESKRTRLLWQAESKANSWEPWEVRKGSAVRKHDEDAVGVVLAIDNGYANVHYAHGLCEQFIKDLVPALNHADREVEVEEDSEEVEVEAVSPYEGVTLAAAILHHNDFVRDREEQRRRQRREDIVKADRAAAETAHALTGGDKFAIGSRKEQHEVTVAEYKRLTAELKVATERLRRHGQQ